MSALRYCLDIRVHLNISNFQILEIVRKIVLSKRYQRSCMNKITCTLLGINKDRFQIERKDPHIKNLKGQFAKHDRHFFGSYSLIAQDHTYDWIVV